MKDNPYVDYLKLARSQRRKLERMAKKMEEMSCEWGELDGFMESELSDLSDNVIQLLATLREISDSWGKGYAV